MSIKQKNKTNITIPNWQGLIEITMVLCFMDINYFGSGIWKSTCSKLTYHESDSEGLAKWLLVWKRGNQQYRVSVDVYVVVQFSNQFHFLKLVYIFLKLVLFFQTLLCLLFSNCKLHEPIFKLKLAGSIFSKRLWLFHIRLICYFRFCILYHLGVDLL